MPQLPESWALVRIQLPELPGPAPAPVVGAKDELLLSAEYVEPVQPALESSLPEPAPQPGPELALAQAPMRPVDIEQITTDPPLILSAAQAIELDGHDAAGSFAARAQAMQIPLPPPPELADIEAAGLQAGAPVEMTVRIGAEAIGNVAFRMSGQHGIDVQLSGLVDLVADQLTVADYAKLRTSAAAGSFVPIEKLREAGLNLRYDPVYDELRLTG